MTQKMTRTADLLSSVAAPALMADMARFGARFTADDGGGDAGAGAAATGGGGDGASGQTTQDQGADEGSKAPDSLLGSTSADGEKADDGDASGDRPNDKGGDSDKSEEEAKAEVIEYDLSAPEGMDLDSESLEAFAPLGNELGITNEGAQKLADLHVKGLQRQANGFVQAHHKMVAGWSEETRADPEIGQDKLDETLQLGDAGLQQLFDQDTIGLLKHFGMLNHVGFVRGMRRAGEIVSDDRLVTSEGKGAEPRLADRLYPDMARKT